MDLTYEQQAKVLEKNLAPCRCGTVERPKLRLYTENYGMDGNAFCCKAVCSCGMQTKGVVIDGWYGEKTTIKDVIHIWNKVMK